MITCLSIYLSYFQFFVLPFKLFLISKISKILFYSEWGIILHISEDTYYKVLFCFLY